MLLGLNQALFLYLMPNLTFFCENGSVEKEEELNQENFEKEFGRKYKEKEEATGEGRHLLWGQCMSHWRGYEEPSH